MGEAMSAYRDDAQNLGVQLRLFEEANERRDLVLTELTQRLMRQTERDKRLLAKLAAARARLELNGGPTASA